MSSLSSLCGKRIRILEEADLHRYEIEKGSRLEVERWLYVVNHYNHFAIYIGDGQVCHLTQDPRQPGNITTTSSAAASGTISAYVMVESFTDMLAGENPPVYINNNEDSQYPPFEPDEIVRRALSKRGKSDYSLTAYNCESFANWCRCGVEFSRQVDRAVTVAGIALSVIRS